MTGHYERLAVRGWTVRAFLCLLFVFPLAARGEEPPPDWTVDNFRWTGVLAPDSAIEVLNPYGDVRLRATDSGEVEVSAQIQRRKSDPVRPEVDLRRRGGRLTIKVAYPAAPRGDLHRVDIAVIVPLEAARVAVRTRDGIINAGKLESDLDLESAGGNITFSTSGTARVSTERGDISAVLREDGWSRAPRLRTRDGNITLTLPEDADARVRVSAGGEIALRRTGRVERQTPHKAVFAFGDGTHPLSLQSRRGRVILLASAP